MSSSPFSSPSASPLMETLVENAKYMPQNGDDDDDDGSPSACELQCQTQQEALVSCMNAIQNAPKDTTIEDASLCLAPSVMAWTDCCSKANNNDTNNNNDNHGNGE